MSAAGLQYIFQRFGGDPNVIQVLYDFANSGTYVNNVSQATSGSFLGQISGSQSTFWANSGYGTFSNHLVTISGTQNLTLSDFSVFFLGNRNPNGTDNVLFSSIENFTSGISSGSHIYINPANKLVFLFNTCQGTQSYVSSFNIAGDFAIGLSKTQNQVNLYQYDYYGQLVASDSFVITRPSDYFPINQFSIGYAPSGANIINNQFYVGKLNTFLLASGGTDSTNAQLFFSGIYVNTTISTTALVSGDECTGIAVLPVSSTMAGSVSTSMSIPSGLFLKQGILIFSQPIITTDLVLLDCAITGQHSFNQPTNTNQNVVKLNSFTFNDVGLYLNGQRLISGQAIVTGSFCTTGLSFPRDYDIFNNRDVQIFNIIATDRLKYDVKDDTYLLQQVLSSGSGAFSVNTSYGIGYYVNGIRNLDYSVSGTTITPQANLNVNDLIIVDYFDSTKIKNNLIVTSNPYFVTGGFIAGTSMPYLNGQRLSLGDDYIEINSGEYAAFLFKNIPATSIFETDGIDGSWNI